MNNNHSNEDTLVEIAKSGDDMAFAQLALEYGNLLNWYISSLKQPESTREDLFQEGLIGLLKAVRSYDGKSSAFSTYASLCIKSSIISAVRKNSAHNKRFVPVSDTADLQKGVSASPERILIDRISTAKLYDSISAVLSPFERTVFELYLSDMNAGEVSVMLKKSEKCVSNAIYRIRRKLKTLICPE